MFQADWNRARLAHECVGKHQLFPASWSSTSFFGRHSTLLRPFALSRQQVPFPSSVDIRSRAVHWDRQLASRTDGHPFVLHRSHLASVRTVRPVFEAVHLLARVAGEGKEVQLSAFRVRAPRAQVWQFGHRGSIQMVFEAKGTSTPSLPSEGGVSSPLGWRGTTSSGSVPGSCPLPKGGLDPHEPGSRPVPRVQGPGGSPVLPRVPPPSEREDPPGSNPKPSGCDRWAFRFNGRFSLGLEPRSRRWRSGWRSLGYGARPPWPSYWAWDRRSSTTSSRPASRRTSASGTDGS